MSKNRVLWASVATAAVLIVLTFCALVASFDVNPYFELNRPEEAALEIQRCALGRPYSCLKFADGLLLHGKDTISLAKFIIDKDDASWTSLSNLIYTATEPDAGNRMSRVFVLQDRAFADSDRLLGMLVGENEIVGEVFRKGYEWITLYLSSDHEGTMYIYIEGVEIRGRPGDRSVHFNRKRK